jgi:hypothetical protein
MANLIYGGKYLHKSGYGFILRDHLALERRAKFNLSKTGEQKRQNEVKI